jgi:thermostable 8-oxoguanine DNA glycosylase
MKWYAETERADIEVVQAIIVKQSSHILMADRDMRNVQQPPPSITEEDMWQSMIMCLITTQNPSGAGSAIESFLSKQPFPLSLNILRKLNGPGLYIKNELSKLRIRRWKISSGFAQVNFQKLEQGSWKQLISLRQVLMTPRSETATPEHHAMERKAAQEVQVFKGLGPKQSRNFWQYLGLTRYEIPLDSRVLRWLSKMLGFNIPSSCLSNERFYSDVMDNIRNLCLEAEVLPCIFDAAIFSLYEAD